GGGEQFLLGPEPAQHGLDGHPGALGDDREGYLVVGPLGEQGAGGGDDRLGGGLGGLGPGPHAVGPLPQPLTLARLHVTKINIKIFMSTSLSPKGQDPCACCSPCCPPGAACSRCSRWRRRCGHGATRSRCARHRACARRSRRTAWRSCLPGWTG